MSVPQSMVEQVQEYLNFRRKLGYALKIEGEELLRFARYADQIGHRDSITTELAVQWATLPKAADPIYWARRLDIVRRFAKYRLLFDPHTEIPPEHLIGPSYRQTQPYIYSDEEISALLQASAQLKPADGLRPRTYATLFGLLVSTGLRISEALRLTRDDVDLKTGVLTVNVTKFQKSRLVPVHHSTCEALKCYSKFRDSYHPCATSKTFFLTEKGTSLNYQITLLTFISLRKKLGWTGKRNKKSPRIHDLRHTFAVRRLIQWYEEGANLDQKILGLSTYLGHVKITNTYWYFHAVPELFAIVSKRFEHFFNRKEGGIS